MTDIIPVGGRYAHVLTVDWDSDAGAYRVEYVLGRGRHMPFTYAASNAEADVVAAIIEAEATNRREYDVRPLSRDHGML